MAEKFPYRPQYETQVEGRLSEEREICMEVPQGSVLSPLLFNFLMADLPIPDNGCELSRFADDVAIYFTADDRESAEEPLQFVLDQIEEWAIGWNLDFSVDKCASMFFSKKKHRTSEPLSTQWILDQ